MDRLQERLLANSPELRDAISDSMVEHGIPLEYLDRVVQMAGPMLPGLMPNIRAQLVELAKGLAPNLEKVLREAAKKGHITTLKKEIAPQTWVDRYQHLHYSIVLLEHAEMILGDSAVLFRVGAARTYKTTIDKDDAIEAALLPISNDRVLMGSSTDVTIPLDLKSAIASTSLEYFISGVDSSTNRSLQPAIGRNSALLTDAEMLAIIDEGLERS